MKKNVSTLLFIQLFIVTCFCSSSLFAEDVFGNAVQASKTGNVKELITNCGDIITGETDSATMAKAYAMLALGYTLQGGKDAQDRCAGLIDLVPDDVAKTPSLPVIRLLAGEIKSDQLAKELASASQDWQAVGAISKYLDGVRRKAKLKELYAYTKEYQDRAIGMPDNWAKAWNPRLILWHKWVQSGKGEKDKLEKFIADNGAKTLIKKPDTDRKEDFDSVSKVVKLFLQNKPEKAREAAVTAKSKYSATNAPLYLVLDYLSGNDQVTPEKLCEATSSKASVWAMATVAMFAKSLSDSKTPNKQMLYYYIDNYDGNFKFLKKYPEITAWKPNVDRWRKWVDSGFKKDVVSGLEPLLIAKSGTAKKSPAEVAQAGFKDITLVELEEFQTGREELYGNRPRPASMEFDDAKFKKYLSSLPEKYRANEQARYITVKDVKRYIVRVLERSPYPNGLVTRTGKKRGVIYMANENILRIKKSHRSKKGKSYKWSEVAFEQYPAFMEYFAKRRLGISGVGQKSKKKIKNDAAMEYLGMAILYDWFGHYETALSYAKKAVKISPEAKERISKMMLE